MGISFCKTDARNTTAQLWCHMFARGTVWLLLNSFQTHFQLWKWKHFFIIIPQHDDDFFWRFFFLSYYSVLEQTQIKSPYPDQRLPQHENLCPIGLKLARIEIPYVGFHYIKFSKTVFFSYKNSFTLSTFMVFRLGKDFLFKSILGRCVM